jgi:putative transposase
MSFYGHPAGLGSRFCSVFRSFADQPEQPFLDALPEARLAALAAEEHAAFGQRPDAVFTPAVTLWAFLLQVVSGRKCCVAAVARVAVLLAVLERPVPAMHTGAYCKARAKLPLGLLQRATRELAVAVEDAAPDAWRWRCRRVLLVDGSTIQLPDTPANQSAYPQSRRQQPGLGFPQMRLVVLLTFATAVLLDAAAGPCRGKETGETALFRHLSGHLRAGDVVVADRAYCSYWAMAELQERGVDVAVRLHQRRNSDFRQGRRLGSGDRLVVWSKPDERPEWLEAEEYARMPATLAVRLVRVRVEQAGYRSQEIVVATTLRDPAQYSRQEIGDLYHRRWHVELDLRSIKQTMQMDELVCKTPAMAEKELWAHLQGYNLVRRMLAASAQATGRSPRQLSLAGALQTLEAFRGELQRAAPGSGSVAALVAALLRAMGSQVVGDRPGRVEPRRVKRRQQKYPLLRQAREQARAELRCGGAKGEKGKK